MMPSSFSPTEQPLAGRQIFTTRPETVWRSTEETDALESRLRQWGAVVVRIPLVEIGPVPFTPPPVSPDWLFFTSQNAVRAFFEAEAPRVEAFRETPIGVVGPATAQTLTDYGRTAAFISPRFDGASAARAFLEWGPGMGQRAGSQAGLKILWPCGNLADPEFATLLKAAGVAVTPLIVYETRPRTVFSPDEAALLSSAPDMIAVTSPSAVDALAQWLTGSASGGLREKTLSENTAIACLGAKTARVAEERLGRADVRAVPHTLDALAEAIRQYYTRSDMA